MSDEEEEEHEDELIFSDELPERGSDTDSENMDPVRDIISRKITLFYCVFLICRRILFKKLLLK